MEGNLHADEVVLLLLKLLQKDFNAYFHFLYLLAMHLFLSFPPSTFPLCYDLFWTRSADLAGRGLDKKEGRKRLFITVE